MRYPILLIVLVIASAKAYAGDVIFQTSTLDALMAGVYDGNFTFGELKKHGNFGLGTVNDLDGEMIGLDGVFYQVKSDGKVSAVPDDAKTPFAVVTFFEADESLPLYKKLRCNELESYIESLLPTKNILYAVKIAGRFDYVKTRSVPRQQKPFPPLTEAVKHETYFEMKNVKGTMAGFWLPDYVKDINATGFHLHFITDDRESGGHVLDCTTKDVKIEIDYSRGLDISLPDTSGFYNADLTGAAGSDVEKVETGKK
ncbi:MAG TPA: acetolactate decarboxylase [Thermodesulfobacteriota bacterium]|nr:acetolactate decarboxylase [Thermodesulfobacteriota bacterium]